jgi:hypothetical protein
MASAHRCSYSYERARWSHELTDWNDSGPVQSALHVYEAFDSDINIALHGMRQTEAPEC